MPKPAFDPTKPFERSDVQKPAFDPNASFLTEDQMSDHNRAGAAQAGLEHFGNAAALGYLPHLQAMASQLLPNPNDIVDSRLRAQGFKVSQPADDYVSERDANIRRLTQQEKDHPTASTAGSVAGSIAGGVAMSPAMKVLPGYQALMGAKAAQGAGLAGKAAALATRASGAAYGGAALGAAANPGDIEGEINPAQAKERAQDAALGGVIGGVLHPAGEAISQGGGYLAGKAKNFAEEKAAKAMGFTKAQLKKILKDRGAEAGMQHVRDLGRTALDEGIVSPTASPGTLAERTEAAQGAAGQAVGDVLDRAEGHFAALPPTGYAQSGEIRTLQKAVKARPIELGLKKAGRMEAVIPSAKYNPLVEGLEYGEGTPIRIAGQEPSAITGKTVIHGTDATGEPVKHLHFDLGEAPAAAPPIEGQMFEAPTTALRPGGPIESTEAVQMQPMKPVFKRGPEQVVQDAVQMTPVKPVMQGRVNAKEIAANLRRNPEISALGKTPGMESTASRVDTMLNTMENAGDDLTLREAQALRRGIDKSINFNKPVAEMRGAQPALYEARDAVRNRMNEIVNDYAASQGGEANQLLQANRRYNRVSDLDKAITDRVSREQANRMIGLTDTIAGGAGAGIGAFIGEKAGGHEGAKAGAMIGAGIGAGANKLGRTYGNQVMASAADKILAPLLAKSPALAALVQKGVSPSMILDKIQGAAKERQDTPDAIPPHLIQKYRENPDLVDKLQNPKLKDALKNLIERAPASKEYVPEHKAQSQFLENN